MRSIASKVMWVGRTAALTVGLAMMLALTVGLASVALAGTGVGAPFNLGQINSVNALSQLVGTVNNAMLKIDNNSTGTAATALDLQVEPGKAPMKVNSGTKVTNLNADLLDGKDSTSFAPVSAFGAAEVIDGFGPVPKQGNFTSKGGRLIISASGSGYRSTAGAQGPGLIGMNVLVDGNLKGETEVFANELDEHNSFVDEYIVVNGLPAGTHTIKLEAINDPPCNTASEGIFDFCTATDNGDNFTVTVVELPN